MIRIAQLDSRRPEWFPPPGAALRDPNGLLAFGGDLSRTRLVAAYAQGVFPWPSDDEPILWWSPDPRCVFATDGVHVSRRLARKLRRCDWRVTLDRDFAAVIRACATPRADGPGTWITRAMRDAYARLHALGDAHSLEVWNGDSLIGGIYGVAVGRMFSAESMFSRESDASKAALLALARFLRAQDFPWIDAQVPNPHLARMGATTLPRARFLDELARLRALPGPAAWRLPAAHVSELV